MLDLYELPLSNPRDSSPAYAMLGALYLAQTGLTPPAIRKGSCGKPYWPGAALHFSLTHTGVQAFFALSDKPVGIDAERIRPVHPRLYARVLAHGERAERPEELLRLWTLKEAYLKYTGEGLHRMPNDLCFRLDGDAASLEGSGLRFRTVFVGDCIISVCAQADEPLSSAAVWVRPVKSGEIP